MHQSPQATKRARTEPPTSLDLGSLFGGTDDELSCARLDLALDDPRGGRDLIVSEVRCHPREWLAPAPSEVRLLSLEVAVLFARVHPYKSEGA